MAMALIEPRAASRDVSTEGEHRHLASPRSFRRRDWVDVIDRVVREISRDRVPTVAAAVAFFLLLSIPPTIGLAVALFGLVADPAMVRDVVLRARPALPPSSRDVFMDLVHGVTSPSGTVHGFGVLVALAATTWAATSGTAMLVESVNLAYDERDDRGYWATRWLALRFTLGILGFCGLSVTLVALLPSLLDLVGFVGYEAALGRWLRWPTLIVAFGLGTSATYRHAPHRRKPRWPWVSWGTVAATLMWVTCTLGFSYYVEHVASYNRIYGSLAGLVVFMFWLYLTALSVLVGAEINAEIEHQTTVDSTVGPELPRGERGAVKADELGPPAPPHSWVRRVEGVFARVVDG